MKRDRKSVRSAATCPTHVVLGCRRGPRVPDIGLLPHQSFAQNFQLRYLLPHHVNWQYHAACQATGAGRDVFRVLGDYIAGCHRTLLNKPRRSARLVKSPCLSPPPLPSILPQETQEPDPRFRPTLRSSSRSRAAMSRIRGNRVLVHARHRWAFRRRRTDIKGEGAILSPSPPRHCVLQTWLA